VLIINEFKTNIYTVKYLGMKKIIIYEKGRGLHRFALCSPNGGLKRIKTRRKPGFYSFALRSWRFNCQRVFLKISERV
jgi:hypothetical protein